MQKKQKKEINPTKVKTIILAIAIALVLTLFVVYLIQAIYPKPEYKNYCEKPNIPLKIINTEEECIANNGTWIQDENLKVKGFCDNTQIYQQCQEDYDNARNKYKLVVFIVAVLIGLISVSAGIMTNLSSVSSGLMLGGTFLVFYGTVVYWANLNNWFRSIILGIVLLILIWLAYKKLEN